MKRQVTIKLLIAGVVSMSAGCTVSSRWGSSAMPTDLRSSSDEQRPSVGAVEGPATRQSVIGRAAGSMQELLVDTPIRAIERLIERSPRQFVGGLKSENPELRRVTINQIVKRSGGQSPPYTTVFQSIAQLDADPIVRATAVRALNRSRDTTAIPVLIEALTDGHPQVRLEAAKALANVPSLEAEASLRKLASSEKESLELKIASIDALRHTLSIESKRLLVDQLNGPNFALAWQSRRSLFLMTGKDFHYDENRWLEYFSSGS